MAAHLARVPVFVLLAVVMLLVIMLIAVDMLVIPPATTSVTSASVWAKRDMCGRAGVKTLGEGKVKVRSTRADTTTETRGVHVSFTAVVQGLFLQP